MEIPSPAAGVVKEIKIKVGDKVSKGSPILVLDSKEASRGQKRRSAARAAAPHAAPAPAPAPTRGADHAPGAARAARRDRRQAARQPLGAQVRARARRRSRARAGQRAEGPHPARRRAGVRKGRAVRKAPSTSGERQAAALPFNLPAWPEVDFAKFGPIESKPLSRIQKLSGPYLHRNWVSIPHVTQFDEADITDLEAFRKAQTVETEKKGFKLTMLAFMIKACVTALRQYPQFNSSLDKSGENIILKKYFHIGVAVDTPGGLVVPVVRDADRKGVFDIARELADITKLARDGKLKPGDMQGGTFSISSLGGIGGTAFTPIINAPEVAILGVSRVAMRPVFRVRTARNVLVAAPDAAAFALLRPSRDRRRHRRALLRLPGLGAVRHPEDRPLDGWH